MGVYDMKKLSAFLNTPARVVIAVGALILTSELLIMLLLENMLSTILKDTFLERISFKLVDPLMLTAIVSPALYLLIFRPLKQQAKLVRAVTESANDAIITSTGDGKIMGWNAAAEQLFGYTEAEINGQSMTVLMPEHFRSLHREGLARVVAGGTPHLIGKTVELIGLRKDGSEFPLELSLAQWQAANGRLFTAIIRDITTRKQVESELRIAATAFESQDGMMITDANKVILRVNHAFTEITGYTAEEAVGQTPSLLNSGRHDAAFFDMMWESIRQAGTWHGEIWNRRKNGEVYPEQLTITAVKGGNNEITHYVATMHDITRRKQAEEQIRALAFYDPLTQLPNRRLLQ